MSQQTEIIAVIIDQTTHVSNIDDTYTDYSIYVAAPGYGSIEAIPEYLARDLYNKLGSFLNNSNQPTN